MNSFAIFGLVAGGISFVSSPGGFCCVCIGFVSPMVGLIGIVLSIVELVQISKNSTTQKGKGFAIAGLALSVLAILATVAYFIFLLKVGEFNTL